MPASYFIDDGLRVVFSRRWGTLTDKELAAHAQALRDDARFHPSFGQLADLRDVVTFNVTPAGIQQCARLNPFAPEARRAAIVGLDVAFGLVRMYQSLVDVDPDNIRLFYDMREAMRWLDLDPSTSWPMASAENFFDSL